MIPPSQQLKVQQLPTLLALSMSFFAVTDLDESFKRIYLVTDKASIRKSKPIVRNIEGRSYKVMYLPPYSPELNPSEIFWKVLKKRQVRQCGGSYF